MAKSICSSMKIFVLLIVAALFVQASTEKTPSAGYHNYEAMTKALKQLADKNPEITKLSTIGKSFKGRDLWMLRISGGKGVKPQEKQALLICGNLEGDHVIGSEVALGIANYLVSQYGKDENITRVLDKRTFYIIPRLNPDGAELFFSKTLFEYSGNLKPRDDDYDWLLDEDGPEDLNNDGKITFMRVRDKEGEWVVDKKDPRLMKKKEAGTPPDILYKIYTEGIDNDGDGLFNEDGPGGFNINRNFPHNFGYKPKGLGVFPASEAETIALIDFMTRYIPQLKTQPHKNICCVLLFSKFDNLAAGTGIESGTPTFPEPPKTAQAQTTRRTFFMFGRRGTGQTAAQPRPADPQPKKTNSQDKYLFETASKKYKEITGIKNALSEKPAGSLLEWAYFQFGVPAFSPNLWSLRQDTQRKLNIPMKKPAQTTTQPASTDRQAMMRRFMTGSRGTTQTKSTNNNDSEWLTWIDKKNNGKGFIKWTPYKHKQLGNVEIGGFEPHLRVNPPADKIPELSENHAKFALHLVSQFAEITMDKPEIKKLSSNLFELKVTIHNNGKFPYATAMGRRSRSINPIILRLKFQDDKNMQLFGGNKRFDLASLDAGAEKEYRWLIISPPGNSINITLWARNGGGTHREKVVLR